MFDDLGQARLCLELDLNSFDGPWQFVSRFRGRSGWLCMSKATLQDAESLFRTELVAACDEQGLPIPGFQARHLLQCSWTLLSECGEHPPSVLDKIIAEETVALEARWHRERSRELQALADSIDQQLEHLDANLARTQRSIDGERRQPRRARRAPDASIELRSQIARQLQQLDEESDELLEDYFARRSEVIRAGEMAERPYWKRDAVLVEVEPVLCVEWQARVDRPPRDRVWRAGAFQAPVRTRRVELAQGNSQTEKAGDEAKVSMPKRSPPPPPEPSPRRTSAKEGGYAKAISSSAQARLRRLEKSRSFYSKEVDRLDRVASNQPAGSTSHRNAEKRLKKARANLASVERTMHSLKTGRPRTTERP